MNAAKSSRIVCGADARESIARSLDLCVKAVATGLGPDRRAFVYQAPDSSIVRAASGLAAIRQIARGTGPHAVGPRMLERALTDVERDVGDGTARVACMAVAMYGAATRHLALGTPAEQLRRRVAQLVPRCDALLRAGASSADDVWSVAMSAACDPSIADALASVDAGLFADGAVDVAEGRGTDIVVREHEGYLFDVADDVIGLHADERRLRVVLNQPSVLVANEVIDDFGALLPVLELFVAKRKSLLIAARGVTGAARDAIVKNRHLLSTNVLAVTPRDVGAEAFRVLEDLCVVTGATMIGVETGTSVGRTQPGMLGAADEIHVSGRAVTFVRPRGASTAIERRRAALKNESARNRYLSLDRERTQRRATRMRMRWASVEVGTDGHHGPRLLSAVRSACAALEAARGGVVRGAGLALADVATQLGDACSGAFAGTAGAQLQRAALDVLGCGLRAIARARARCDGGHAWPSSAGDAVVDPLSTTLELLHHAVSLALTLMTIEVLVC